MDRTNTQEENASQALEVNHRPSPTANQTTYKPNPQTPNTTPKCSPVPRAIHRQLPRIQTTPPTATQQVDWLAIQLHNFSSPSPTAQESHPPPTTTHQPFQPFQLTNLAGPQPTTVRDAVQLKLAKLGPSRRGLECTAELDVLMDRLRYVVRPESAEEARVVGRRRDPAEVSAFWGKVREGVRVADEEVWRSRWDGLRWGVSP
ncbi:predicted protein [Chaetomium globosum CBS 148.51]|uniref:Uncharacterized protein n=1 Tax=Chaetomium globosum (strain ATCC 6205 / CBS 148.51 / DSM 1962 / NBRC 6347 / NRRL 1970) TaxID=306901 RepID=Q2GM20_CHAGB|nr:uncharacterized protein CHGG_10984 [Chaetomium globosum CBS 148.51]EAQ83166.1 predicted protein [Chaetomium globosum CBS 148.51]